MKKQSQRNPGSQSEQQRKRKGSNPAQLAHEILREVDYPASRDVLVEQLRNNDPDDADIGRQLAQIPDREYISVEDVEEALAAAQ